MHWYEDVRVFQKQAVSLTQDFKQVSLFSRCDKSRKEKGVDIKKVPTFKSRLLRFLYLNVLFFRVYFHRADLYIFHNPDTLPLLFALKLLGKKVVYDTHEDFSKRILMRAWLPSVLRPIFAKSIEFAESIAYFVSNAFIVTQGSLVEKYGSKSFLIENPPVLTEKPKKKIENSNAVKDIKEQSHSVFKLIYVGGISVDRGVFDILNGLTLINQSFLCELILIGPVTNQLLDDMQGHVAWKHVSYMGVLPQHEAFAWMKKSDVGLVWLKDIGDYSETSPNKLFEYSAMEIPFVSTNFKLWKSKFKGNECGVFIEAESLSSFEEAIKYFYTHPSEKKEMGARGYSFVHKEYNWNLEYKKFKSVINKALK